MQPKASKNNDGSSQCFYLQGLKSKWLLSETQRQQHTAKLGCASPQFNLQVSSYQATRPRNQATTHPSIRSLAG